MVMSGLIQLSDETRGVLLDAYPTSAQPRRVTRSELPRTARAARDLLWTSHREELGYCAAATAYLMEFDSSGFVGVSFSAPDHSKYKKIAERATENPIASVRGLNLVDTCKMAAQLAPSASNLIRLGVATRDLSLIADRANWLAAYSGRSDQEQLAAGTAQNAGLVAGLLGRLGIAAMHYRESYELAGGKGDWIMAWLLETANGGKPSSHQINIDDLGSALEDDWDSIGIAFAIDQFQLGSRLLELSRADSGVALVLEQYKKRDLK